MKRLLVLCLLLANCGGEKKTTLSFPALIIDDLPKSFPRPLIPESEPLTPARVELGRRLFYDKRLSHNGTQSCATCHVQTNAFADNRTVGVGSTGESHFRNVPSVVNVAYRGIFTWANPTVTSLSEQALLPLFGEHPVELGNLGQEDALLARIKAEPLYADLFSAAFPDDDSITLHSIVVAIAAFQRNILSYRAPYDRFAYTSDRTALSDAAQRGMRLFFGERLECSHCHAAPDFTDSNVTQISPRAEVATHNTGLYNLDTKGAYPTIDRGLMNVTKDAKDMGHFRTPSLRNVALTAPYFHDGSAATLDDVIDHYAHGGRLIKDGANAGDGSQSPLKDDLLRGFTISADERSDLKAFLESLTDNEILHDPRLGDPWIAY